MKTHKHSVLYILLAALWIIAGASCNTFRGFGRDVERTGEHIERAAR